MSRVRIYQCNTYKKQNTLSPVDEPLELHIWDNLLFVSTKSSMIEIYNINSLQLVGKFSTISQAETLIYSEYGNCIITMERADSNALHCFVRLYMGFPCPLIDLGVDSMVKESFLVVGLGESESFGYGDKYLTGGMTRCKQEIHKKAKNTQDLSREEVESWDVERVELPTQAAVNCVGVCSHTGFLAVAWDVSITLYMLTQDMVISETPSERKAIKCGVSVLMEMEIGFVVTTLVVEDIYLACLSEFEVQVLKLQLMPRRYTSLPKEKKLSPYLKTMLRVEESTDDSEPEIQQSSDFIQLRSFYSYPALHVGVGENGRDKECYPGILQVNTEIHDELELENKQIVPEEHCIIFPSVSKESMQSKGNDFSNKMVEIWGPSRVIENRALKVVTPDGHKLTNSGISTMLYLKLPPTIVSCTEYTLSTTSTDKGEKSIDVFHTLKLIPEYLSEGDQQHLVGMCLLVASKKEGLFYDIFDYCRRINTFPFTKNLVDIVMSPGLMHVVYLSRIEVYITRSYGVASENARDLIRQGKVYNIDIGTAVSTPSEEALTDSVYLSEMSTLTKEERLNFQSPLYWLYQVSPSPKEMDISQIGQSIFMNLNSCTNTDNRIAILSKYKPETKPSSHSFPKLVRKNSAKLEDIVWSIYILDITPLHSIAKQMEIMAQPYILENPPIYFQLLCDAHFLRKSAITREQANLFDEDDVECVNVEPVDSIVISITPSQQDMNFPSMATSQQLLALQRSCLLLANCLRQENEQLALQYYKQGSYDLNQFLQNSVFHSNTSLISEESLSPTVYTSLTSSTLKSMTSTMCFTQSDASLLARSIMHNESLSPGEIEVKESDCMVHKVFLLCVHLENDDEMKAKEAVCELSLNSRSFSVWANEHINTFVTQDNEGNLSHLGMYLLIEAPTLIAPLLPKICEMGLIQAGHIIELIKHNTEDTDRAEMTLEFITDLIRLQSISGNEIQELDLAIEELIVLCLSLFENRIELETRKVDSICAEFRPNWLDYLPPFREFERDEIHNSNLGNLKSYIFIVQNILYSPLNSLQMSEKILENVQSSEYYVGIRAVIYMKLGRYRELVLMFLYRYEQAFPVFCDSIQIKAVRYTIIRCIVSDILENTWESDMLSLEMREKAFYFIISLTKCMTFKEILEILPEESPADLYKRCFDYHLHIEKSEKIMQDLINPDFNFS